MEVHRSTHQRHATVRQADLEKRLACYRRDDGSISGGPSLEGGSTNKTPGTHCNTGKPNGHNRNQRITSKTLRYLRLRAFSRSKFIKFAFNFLSSLVSTARQSESGPSSNCSPVSVSAAPSTFLTTASITSACWLPSSSWYLW